MEWIRKLPIVQSLGVNNHKVLLRVDFNVPIVDGAVCDKTRIERAIPTIEYLINAGSKVLIISHLGRPKGEDPNFSLQCLVSDVEKALGKEVHFVPGITAEKVNPIVDSLPQGSVLLLENLRFFTGETENSADFAKSLASLADIYVNDAFSCSHRKHASVDAITSFIPSFSGLGLQKELEHLCSIVSERPAAAIIGGAKTSTKIPMLCNLVNKVDFLVIGGGLSNSFLAHVGSKIGSSFFEPCDQKIGDIFKAAQKSNCKIILPMDHIVAHTLQSAGRMKDNDCVESEDSIFDIGKKTISTISDALRGCKTIFWNGPMGVFEQTNFAKGTFDLAKILVELKKEQGANVIIGGGDSISAIKSAGYTEADFSYVSTGGGALLRFLAGA